MSQYKMKASTLLNGSILVASMFAQNLSLAETTMQKETPPVQNIPASVLTSQNGSQPVWAIAHRVLTKGAVDAALAHHANALEVDVRYESAGSWWAAHDPGALGKGDNLQNLLNYIATKSSLISFVWLDMKTPDGCDNELGKGRQNMQGCKIKALTDMARNTLEQRGIRVLYGFSTDDGGPKSGLAKVASSLTKKEGISISAGTLSSKWDSAVKMLQTYKVPLSSSVIDRGLFNPSLALDNSIINDLKRSVGLKSKNQLSRVFGWTAVYEKHISALMGTGADGIIYGNAATQYSDSASNRQLAQKLRDYVHSNHMHIATNSDIPFGEGSIAHPPKSRLKSLRTGECLAVNIYNNPVMTSCDDATEWEVITLPSHRFNLHWKSLINTKLCLTEWDGALKAGIKCGDADSARYQEWQWEGEHLKNGKYYLNGPSLIKDINSPNAYQSRWVLF